MFIAAEGPEGAGKGRLIANLAALYRGVREVIITQEPGTTPIGKEFRRILKDPKYQGTFPPLAELFGFLAARAVFVEQVVKPALAEGKVVLTDRFSLSTMAYQIAGRGLPEEPCMQAIQLAEGGVQPQYVVLLVSPEVGLARKKKQGDDGDRFAKESLDFHRRVHGGYLKYGQSQHAIVVDTDNLSAEEVFQKVRKQLGGV